MIDSRGRLFGRLNVVDALVLVFALGLVPLAYAAYYLFRMPAPVIAAVEPAVVPAVGERRIRLTGEHFVPYLRAFFWKHGEPLALLQRQPAATQGRFLLESPFAVEIRVPPELPAGTYDIYLFDETRQVAHRPAAFTVAPARVQDATYDVTVRFLVSPEIAPLVKVGEVDTTEDPAVKQSARILAVTVEQQPVTQIELTLAHDWPRYFGAVTRASSVLATVRVNARETEGILRYGSDRLRAGERLSFQTRDYTIRGTVLRVERVTNGE